MRITAPSPENTRHTHLHFAELGRRDLSPESKLILAVTRNSTYRHGQWSGSLAWLSEAIGLSQGETNRALDELVEADLITISE